MITDEAKRVKAQAYAESVREVVERKHTLESKIANKREEMGLSSVVYNDKVSVSPSMDTIPNGVAFIADMIAKYSADLNEYVRVIYEFESIIHRLWPQYEHVLELRYVQCRHWSEIAEIASYNDKYIHDIHRSALIGLYDVMPEEWRRR